MAKESRNDEARRAILREWDDWTKNNPTAGALKGMAFFNYLRNERSELLDFKSGTVDKWQTVHGWLLRGGRVKD